MWAIFLIYSVKSVGTKQQFINHLLTFWQVCHGLPRFINQLFYGFKISFNVCTHPLPIESKGIRIYSWSCTLSLIPRARFHLNVSRHPLHIVNDYKTRTSQPLEFLLLCWNESKALTMLGAKYSGVILPLYDNNVINRCSDLRWSISEKRHLIYR